MEDIIDEIQQIKRISLVREDYFEQEECIPTSENYHLWLNSLDETLRHRFSRLGFELCKAVTNYKRFILEVADIGMSQFMRQRLTFEDFQVWEAEEKMFRF